MSQYHLLWYNLKAMSLIGLWEPPNVKRKDLFNIYSKCVFTWFCSFTFTQSIELFFVYNDLKEVTSNAGVSLLCDVAISKIYITLFKKDKFQRLVRVIQKSEERILNTNDPEMKKVLGDYVAQNWVVTKQFWLLTFWTILGFFIKPKLETFLDIQEDILFANGTVTGMKKKTLVFSSWFPFDKYSDKYYPLAYGIQTFSGIVGASYLGVWDTFIVALMIFAIGQLRVLQYSIKNLNKRRNFNKNDENDQGELCYHEVNRNFVNCVKHHHMIIKYVKELDLLISPVMFLDLGVCTFMLCAIGLQAVLEGPTIRLFFTIEYLMAMLIQLFMFYWHANEIMLESLNVTQATWESEWYNCHNNITKGLVLVMLRAQKPLKLTAGKFYTMSLGTFIMILRASYSYMALLRQVMGHSDNGH